MTIRQSIIPFSLIFFFSVVGELFACGGKDVVLSQDPVRMAARTVLQKDGYAHFDRDDNLLLQEDEASISPERARSIVEQFARKRLAFLKKPFRFRKLEFVHGKLIYQFESEETIPDYNGKYHLGPVNFIVDRLVLDVDAKTGDIYIANGCGAAPGKLVYKNSPWNVVPSGSERHVQFVSNNTNFIAMKTGNTIKIDGKIEADEWENTGHKYFHLGTYKEHERTVPHEKPYYYAEIWSQIDDERIYFAVKTDNPYWIGLMFKNDPNLGMLGSYRDAKVLKSNGEITDRHFTQREDKTFFLQNDEIDNILSRGNRQDDAYTYELAFPLKTKDKRDVSLEIGRAYNMLLLVGNTLDHYGIFTLDDAHKNHDHSKNNKEHADVWASNETLIRIGKPAEKDIFGNPVSAVFTSYVSGYDPSRKNHFHYAGHSIKDFDKRTLVSTVVGWLSVALSFAGFGFIYVRLKDNFVGEQVTKKRKSDQIRSRWLRRFIEWKHFRTFFTVPTLVFFVLIIFYGIFDVQDGRRNIATVYTWTIWWSLVIVSFILFGRFWCMMCPFAAVGDLAQKIVSLNRMLPPWLQNMGFQTLAFILLTLAFALYAFDSKPLVTAIVILGILLFAIFFSIIYRRRSFCRHICPIGAVIGIYSTVSPFELRACSESRCAQHRTKTCSNVCPMLEEPYEMDNNIYCNFCMKCQEACPSKNLGLRFRSFGKDLYASVRKTPMEAVASLFLLGIVIVETLAMTSAWQPLQKFTRVSLSLSSDPVAFSVLFFSIVLLPIWIFVLLSHVLKIFLGKDYRVRDIVTTFAFVFVPLGIALHLAHNMQHLFNEGPVVVPATLRLLQNLGIGMSLSLDWNPAPLLGTGTLFILQMLTLLAGMALSFLFLYRVLKKTGKPLCETYKTAAAMTLYALVVMLSSVYMLGLPMNVRHIH